MSCHHIRKSPFCLLLPVVFLLSFVQGCGSAVTNATSNGSGNIEPANLPAVVQENVPEGCADFQVLVEKTYTFKPSKLTATEQTAKSNEMDVIWEKVKGNKDLIPCLKFALAKPNADPFFLFDGSNLLISLDQSDDSKKLLIASFAKTDIRDVDPHNWIAYILMFGLEGLDTSAAGDAWLSANDPRYYLPEHGGLPVDKKIGALAIYGSMDEKFATPALLAIVNKKDHPGREIALRLLIQQVTPQSTEALKKVDVTGLSAAARDEIRKYLEAPDFILPRLGPTKIGREEFLGAFRDLTEGKSNTFMDLAIRVNDGEKDAIVVLKPEDTDLVRRARRFFASTGTPHAPEWYESFTSILMVMVRKPQLDQKSKI